MQVMSMLAVMVRVPWFLAYSLAFVGLCIWIDRFRQFVAKRWRKEAPATPDQP